MLIPSNTFAFLSVMARAAGILAVSSSDDVVYPGINERSVQVKFKSTCSAS